jgi:hypothetical protein
MFFCFVQNFFFGQHKSYNIFFLSREARNFFPVLFSFMTYHLVFYKCNTIGVPSIAGTAFPSGAPEFIHQFLVGFVLLNL